MLNPVENRVLLLTRELFEDLLVKNFLNKNYTNVLIYLRRKGTIFELSTTERALFGLCLCLTGNISDALREISVAVELADCRTRPYALLFLAGGYYISGNKQVFNRICGELDNAENKELLDRFRSDSYVTQLNLQEESLNLNLDEKLSLKKRIFKFHKIISSCSRPFLNQERFVTDVDTLKSSIQQLFNSILDFMNLPALCDVQWIGTLLEHLKNHYEEQLLSNNQNNLKTYKSFVVFQVIKGFWFLQMSSHQEAFEHFVICIDFIKSSESCTLFFDESELYHFKSIYILCSQALLFSDNDKLKSERLDTLLFEIAQFEVNVPQELESGCLEYHFQITGSLIFEKAILSQVRSTEIPVSVNRDDISDFLRQFIVLSTLKFNDDALLRLIYESILSGLFLRGGISIRAFWFFSFLLEFFSLEQCLHQTVSNNYGLSPLLQAVNEAFIPIISRFSEFETILSQQERDDISNNSYLLPQAHLRKRSHDSREDPIKVILNFRRLSLKQTVSEEDSTSSSDLAHLWMKSYEDFNGFLPKRISQMCYKLNL